MDKPITLSVSLFVLSILCGSGCMDIPSVDGNPKDPQSSNYVPSAPFGIYCYAASTTSIMVVWHDASLAEDGFEVERRDAQSTFVLLGRIVANGYSFLDTSSALIRRHIYYYRVRAYSATRFSEYSDEATGMLP